MSWSGLPLWCALINKALNTNFEVNIALLLHLGRDLPQEISSKNNRPKFRECFDYNVTLEDLECTLTSNLDETLNANNKGVLFIDSLDVLIAQFDLMPVIQLLNRLSDTVGAVVCVTSVGKNNLNWRRLCSVSSATFDLEFSAARDLICTTRTRKKDGLLSEKIETFEVCDKDLSLHSSAYNPNTAKESDKESKPDNQLLEDLPFDIGLRLSEKEREAKANVQLPYVKAQDQKGLVGLNISSGKKIKVGGNIIYTPDKEDDLDDSDPDDDLMI